LGDKPLSVSPFRFDSPRAASRHGLAAPSLRLLLLFTFFLFLPVPSALAQQPFYTDDADVTEHKRFHLQFSDEYDVLQRFDYPSLRQNTSVLEVGYGLARNLEVSVNGPLIGITNSRVITPRNVIGLGDIELQVKYNPIKEHEGSKMPALAATFAIEFPTGSTRRGLGSGLADYFLNGILQKSVTKKTKLRLNGGILFAGNDTTGEIGIKSRGTVFVGGASVVKQFTPKLDLGAEVTGALTRSFQLDQGQVQTQIGGNYAINKKMTFDFGIVAGRFNTTRLGLQLGVSIDF
jgi:outer membrane putative beta-barrel porin/alpha-amylase